MCPLWSSGAIERGVSCGPSEQTLAHDFSAERNRADPTERSLTTMQIKNQNRSQDPSQTRELVGVDVPRLVVHLREYRYLGDYAACEMWAARHMTCARCRVSWTGCWDNFMCPECGEGELPSCEPADGTLGKLLLHNAEPMRGQPLK